MTQTTLDGSATPFIVPAGTNDIANDGDSLVLLGSIANLGTLTLNGSGTPPAGAPSPADIASLIVASPTVTLTGGGTLDMAANSDSFILGAAVQSTLINQDNTIEGEGLIGASGTLGNGVVVYPFALINGAGGVIDGNGTVPDTQGPPDGIEILTSTTASTMINEGLIEATNVGGVAIIADTIDQSGGGTLLATGSNDVVFLSTNGPNETDIVGGTLDVMNGGVIADIGTLDGSTSPVTIAAGSTMAVPGVMFGTIDNLGTLDAALGFGGYEGPYLTIDGPALTLTGGGSLLLANGTIIGAADALATLVNGGNTIAGVGVIGVASIDNTSIGPIGSAAPVALTNDSGGVVDAIGTTGAEFELVQFGGGAALVNAGLLEATQAGTLALTADTIFNTSGTILAAGAGAVVSLNTISLFGGQLASTGGGEILFGGGNNTLEAPSGEVGIAAGGTLDVAASATLALQTATLDNSGTFIDGGDLTLTGAGTTLNGGGGLALAGIIGGLAGTALINVDNTISGTGELSGGSLTNDAAGVIAGVGLNFASPVSNLGTLTNCSVGLTTATTIDNAGATLLANAGTIGLYNADIVGGMLLATNGGQIDDGEQDVAGGNTTLDGRNSAVTIAAGTTLTAWVQGISLPFYFDVLQNLTLLGTIELLGTIDATDTNPFGGGGTFTDNAVVVAGGSAAILGSVTNDGTLLTHSGTFTVGGDVNGVGTIDIAAGATFDLGGTSTNTIDFGDTPNTTLAMLAPTHLVYVNYSYVPEANFTGTLANLTMGDTLDFVGAALTSANVVGGTTLAVGLTGGATLDYALANLPAGTKAALASSTPTPTEIFDFSYTATTGTAEPDSTTSGTGSITVTTGNGTADLASVTAFTLDLAVSTTDGAGGLAGTDQLTYGLANLVSFDATFGAGDALTGLSLVAKYGGGSTFYSQPQDFEVLNLGTAGAETQNSYVAQISQGSIDVTPVGQLLSDVVIACFVEGTAVRTARGNVRVQALREGDLVATVGGACRPVVWLGHRRVDCGRHPKPADVWPVRVRAHAFAPSQPHRDVLLSPDHAVFVDGVLIPVRHLIDGEGIVQEPRETVTYWHVELDRHDVVLADGLPCESFLDTGQRGAFADGGSVRQLQADFAQRVWDADACAPVVVTGPLLDQARERLASAWLRKKCTSGFSSSTEPRPAAAGSSGGMWRAR